MTSLISPEEYKAITGAWDYSTLPTNVRLGQNCFLERRDSFKRYRSKRDPGLVLGDNIFVYTWTEFNIEPEGQVFVGENSVLVGAVFMCAQEIRIGKRVVISYNATIADSDFHPTDPELRKKDAISNAPYGDKTTRPTVIAKPVIIEDDVEIGVGAIILKGVRVGKGAILSAGVVVTKDVPPGARMSGNPARIVGER